MNKIELFNRLARHARPAFQDYKPLETLDIPFSETGLDSMDSLMITIYLSELYGVEEAVAKEFKYTTPAELFELVVANKTKEPASVEEAMEQVQ